jgi:pimeloyl-ACP methyl ester carboxylesterase
MEHTVRVEPDVELWVEERGDHTATPLLLIMGANASGIAWPDRMIDRLAEFHWVVRYDHRDTGRSTHVFASRPYAIRDLAVDVVTVLDALRISRAHMVGFSMGGTLLQLLLLDHPERVTSATLFATCALGTGLANPAGHRDELPGPDLRLLSMWRTMGEERDREAEMSWRLEHWRLLNGGIVPFAPDEFRELEERVMSHSGTFRAPTAHAQADQSGLNRRADLANVTVPTLVIEAPEDPINPPPHAAVLASSIGSARLAVIPGMGHALNEVVIDPLVEAILAFTAGVDRRPAIE